ncbi:Acidic phosphoprotein precursor PCEMA1, putative [Plasmodium chabaudi adami]|uniref:Acidic phosphoprotein PCEMA1, putative n=1 Tax=Plasmodium chabaudi adami TaxID=5826 RepID=A0A1C6WV05_PLACE|nr:Acidic phosphoprotein precursor PCEMA1, putative [Plasmodium chabaudi adami]
MNKFYIQIALFLLNVFVYANNETLATELSSEENTTPQLYHSYPIPEKIHKKKKHLSFGNPREAIDADQLMSEAVQYLEHYATSKDGYKLFSESPDKSLSQYKKKLDGDTDILKINLNIYASSQYDYIINKYWDPDTPNIFNTGIVKIARVYDPNLVLIQHRYEKDSKGNQKYFYALMKRAQISENKTIIVMTSPDIDDHNPYRKKYKNKIVKSADLFKISIDSEYGIRQRGSSNVHVNLAGYLIEKKGENLEITYVESIEGHSTF